MPSAAQTKVVAHRGYWKTAGAAQNSIASLRNAAEIGAYASEFDVYLTKDGIPVVNHSRRIGCKKIGKHNYSKFADRCLSNGECLPTLEEYLREGIRHPHLKLVMEIKPASGPESEKQWVKTIVSMVEESGAGPQVEYISFSLDIVKELVALTAAPVAYLGGDISPGELHRMGVKGIDYSLKVMRARPEWFRQARELGMSVNVWTVNKIQDMEWLISEGADMITTDEPVRLQETIGRLASD